MHNAQLCGLTTLETRTLRGDNIVYNEIKMFFKILNVYENIGRNIVSSHKNDRRTKGHEVKLVKDKSRLDIKKCSIFQRITNE